MMRKRILGPMAAVVALTGAVLLYSTHQVRSSDHQGTIYLATQRPQADISDMFIFPAANPANVVLVMNVYPLIPPGQGPTKFFDPAVMYQFKIAHGNAGVEDQVIQLNVNGTDANQTITLYGPAAPVTAGPTNTFLPAATGTFSYNVTRGTKLNNGIIAFAGPRADPFFFDLFQFFTILPDRNYQATTHPGYPAGDTPGSLTPAFKGFAATDTAGAGAMFNGTNLGNYPCVNSTSMGAPQNALTANGFNELSIVLEVPRALLTTSSPKIHVWATTSITTAPPPGP